MKKLLLILLINFNLINCSEDQDAFFAELYHSKHFIPEELQQDEEFKKYLEQESNEDQHLNEDLQENKEDVQENEKAQSEKSQVDFQGFDPLEPYPKSFRTICKLCGHTPKKFKKHLFEVHFICGCAQQYLDFSQAKTCQLSHKRGRKNPKLLKFVAGIKPIIEEIIYSYKCDLCNKKTVTNAALNSHQFFMHYICYICGVRHSTRDQAFECKKSH